MGANVFSTPVVRDGRVYVGAGGAIHCLELATGKELWRGDYKCGELGGPTVANGVLYAGVHERKTDDEGSPAVQYYVVALDASSGRELWKIEAPSLVSPLVAAGGAVYFGAYHPALYCVNAKTGRELWKNPTLGYRWDSRMVYTPNRVYATIGGGIAALNAQNGKQIWSRGPGRPPSGFSPVVNGRIFVAYAIGGISPPSRLEALDAATGKKLWSFTPDGWVIMDPVAWEGNVFFGTMGSSSSAARLSGDFYVLDAETGELKWQFHSPQGAFWLSPAVADGVVYVLSHDGLLRAFDVSDGTLLWQFQDERPWFAMPMWAPRAISYLHAPAVADGLLLIRAFGGLYALGPAETEVSPGDAPEEAQPEPSSPQTVPQSPDASRPSDRGASR
ncbi:MAG: outer membrane protein assembly factor BamB family protein [Planctomycetota bacterium]